MLNIVQELRENSYDKFITSLFCPDEVREKLLIIYALQYELSKISDLATTEMVGFIRLKWWHDEIEKIFDFKPVFHDLLIKLSELIPKYHIIKDELLDFTDSFAFEFADNKFEDFEQIHELMKDRAIIYEILFAILEFKDNELAKIIGNILFISDYFRTYRNRFNRNRLYFDTNKVHEKQIFKDLEKIYISNYKLLKEKYKSLLKEEKIKLRPLLLQVSISKLYMDYYNKNGIDSIYKEVRINRLKLLLMLYWKALFYKF